MTLQTFLEPTYLLQTLALALSIFNLIAFLWLAFTVWLNGDRSTWIARLGVVGLGLSAFFFFIHALLISSPLNHTRTPGLISLDSLWHLIWLPALGVPFIWFAIGLHYAALISEQWRRRRPLLLLSGGMLGTITLLLLVLNAATFTFTGTLQLLAFGDPLGDTNIGLFTPIILVPVLFLCYVTFCAIGPWLSLGRVSRLLRVIWHYVRAAFFTTRVQRHRQPAHQGAWSSLRRALSDAFWEDPADVELLEEPVLSWHLARPILLLAALLMVGLTSSLGALGVWSIVDLLAHQQLDTLPTPTLQVLPLNLLVLDILATGAIALIILLVGYSIVRHGILIERSLARRGFFEQWRGTVIVATAVAIFIALLVTLTRSNLGGLLLIASLATAAYALFTWSNYTAHDRYIALLGPFLRSTNMRHWLNTDLQKTEQELEDLFSHLCQDVLAVQCARLTVMAGPVRSTFNYRWPKVGVPFPPPKPDGKALSTPSKWSPTRVRMNLKGQPGGPVICWVLPIYDERGLVATLYLGPRQDGGVFTDEDMELARACGQRILDTLGEHEAMQAVAGLLRRRIVDVKLLGAQQRRVLHDEILPQMHLALLRLETLRSLNTGDQKYENDADNGGNGSNGGMHSEQALDEVVEMISDAHRRLATMMRATTPAAPHRLERDGLMHAIHTMLAQDFQNAFDEVAWCVSEETASYIDEITPPAIAELIFAAVQEALRNAARHARGSDLHRRVQLTLKASCQSSDSQVEVTVADDGVGITSSNSSTTGTGGGLLIHSALLAIAGGSLTIKTAPDEGVTVRIFLPPESLR